MVWQRLVVLLSHIYKNSSLIQAIRVENIFALDFVIVTARYADSIFEGS